jgi:hypothetical protein
VVWFCFVCFRSVSCIPNVASFFWLSILIASAVFFNVYLHVSYIYTTERFNKFCIHFKNILLSWIIIYFWEYCSNLLHFCIEQTTSFSILKWEAVSFLSCTGWTYHVLGELIMYWVNLSCTEWTYHVLGELIMYWVNLSCTGWTYHVLGELIMYWVNLSCTGWTYHVLGELSRIMLTPTLTIRNLHVVYFLKYFVICTYIFTYELISVMYDIFPWLSHDLLTSSNQIN